jgi:hypothetical protein
MDLSDTSLQVDGPLVYFTLNAIVGPSTQTNVRCEMTKIPFVFYKKGLAINYCAYKQILYKYFFVLHYVGEMRMIILRQKNRQGNETELMHAISRHGQLRETYPNTHPTKSISKSLLNFTWQILCFANL